MSFPAVCTVHTVNGPTPCCARHAGALRNLMSFMGASVNIVLLGDMDPPQECTNCVNQAKSQKPDRAETWMADDEGSTPD